MSVRSIRYSTIEQHFTKGVTASTDRDALAFLEAAQIYNTNQQRAIVNLVRSLKRVGLWSKMKAIYPFVGGTASTHKFNLKDPRDVDAAFRLTFTGGWTHSSTGALPNGSNAYADTFINAQTDLNKPSIHKSFYSRTDTQIVGTDIGGSDQDGPYDGLQLYIRLTDGFLYADIGYYGGAPRIKVSNSNGKGYYISSRTATNNFAVYKNNSLLANNLNTDTTVLPSVKIFIAANNTTSSGVIQYSNKECAFASFGDGLTDTDATKLYNIVDLYQKRLGRAV